MRTVPRARKMSGISMGRVANNDLPFCIDKHLGFRIGYCIQILYSTVANSRPLHADRYVLIPSTGNSTMPPMWILILCKNWDTLPTRFRLFYHQLSSSHFFLEKLFVLFARNGTWTCEKLVMAHLIRGMIVVDRN